MKIWVVWEEGGNEGYGGSVLGVYSNRIKAEDEHDPRYHNIEEFELDGDLKK